MNIDEFFKKWSAICDAHEGCEGCPMDGNELICLACGDIERAIEKLERIMSLQKKKKFLGALRLEDDDEE